MEVNVVAKMALLNPIAQMNVNFLAIISYQLFFFFVFYNLIAFLHTKTKRKHESDLLPTYVPSMCK